MGTVAHAQIFALQTKSIPHSQNILRGVQDSCNREVPLAVIDMKGDQRKGWRLLNKSVDDIRQQSTPLITIGLPATKLAQRLFVNHPIFFAMVANPEQKGLEAENISGIATDIPLHKQLDMLSELNPLMKHVGVVFDPRNSQNTINSLNKLGEERNLNIIAVAVNSPKKVPAAYRSLINKVDSIVILPDATVINRASLEFIVSFTLENKIPTATYSNVLAKSGFLLGASPDYSALGDQIADIICPRQPAIQNQKFIKAENLTTSINIKTAERLGYAISPSTLERFDEVY